MWRAAMLAALLVLVAGLSAAAESSGARAYAPAWQDPERVGALVAEIAAMRADGLDPEDYGLSRLSAWSRDFSTLSSEQRAELDAVATGAYLLALDHLGRGKVDPRRVDARYNLEPPPPVGAGMPGESASIADAFARARPAHPVYRRLQEALGRLRETESAGGWPAIPDGPALRLGADDARVPLLRRRLVLGGYLDPADTASTRFDDALAAALRDFQSEQYLDADGVLGQRTRAVLNVPVAARIDQVRVNLERARWLLREVQGDFVVVDLAGFKVSYFKNGEPVWTAHAQVGRPYRATPTFKSRIDAVTFNPTWTVPPTIFRHDLLPEIRANPAVLKKKDLHVLNGSGEEIPASEVDWRNPRGLVLRQPAGPTNPLGRVRIGFANPFGVYMHDTSHPELFGRGQRAFSSGCIRLERPLELVEYLLDGTPGWDHERIEQAVASGETKSVRLERPTTLLVLYWSVDTHGGARIAFKPDLYGRDAAVLRELDRKTARAVPAQ